MEPALIGHGPVDVDENFLLYAKSTSTQCDRKMVQIVSPQAHEKPVFVFTMHRSGGTLLARLLNVHPDIVIWGEHGGWINKLAEIDAALARMPEILHPPAERELKAYASGEAGGKFAPWASPFELSDFRKFSHDLICSTFTKGVAPHQRWGFKEIRYHHPRTAKFLADIFPMGSFILLKRDPIKIVTSSIMAPWSTRDTDIPSLDDSMTVKGFTHLIRAVFDCSYAVAAMESGFSQIERELPGRCLTIDYNRMNESMEDALRFLSLRDSEVVQSGFRNVLQIRAGETPKLGKKRRAFIESLASWGFRKAQSRIASHGIDFGRLRRLNGGHYSFLVGDHYLADTDLSSMF